MTRVPVKKTAKTRARKPVKKVATGSSGLVDDYVYDIFISFPSGCTAGRWVVNHFRPVLEESLQEIAGGTVKVYCFTEQPAAMNWPNEVQQALLRSKVMVAVLTPPYFHSSAWCIAEWTSMLERQKIEKYGTDHNPRTLVYPVVYSDGEHFPKEATDIRSRLEMRQFAEPDPQFKDMHIYVEFRRAVRKLAKELVELIEFVPKWSSRWPLLKRPPLNRPKAKLPRL